MEKTVIVYHIPTDPQKFRCHQQICTDRIAFREDATMYMKCPANTPQDIQS